MVVVADHVIVELEAKLQKYNANVLSAQKQFTTAMARMDASARRAERSTGQLGLALKGFITGATILKALQYADAATKVKNALAIAGLQGGELTTTYERLFDIAQAQAVPFEELGQLYGRVALAQKELNASSDDLINFTENVAKALRVSGKSAQEARGALLQLSQAVGSGIVRAEEFNAILEGALPIAQAAAAGLTEAGGSVAKLRTLIIDGKVSSEAFFRAFEAGSAILDDQLSRATFTAAQQFTQLQNSLIYAAGEMNNAFNVTDALGGQMQELTGYIQTLTLILSNDFAPALSGIIGWIQQADKAVHDWAQSLREMIGLEGALQALDDIYESSAEKIAKINEGFDKSRFAVGFTESQTTAQRFGTAFGSVKPVSLGDFKAPSGTDEKGKRFKNAFEDEMRQLRERTAALQVEAGAVGLSVREAERRRAVLELEQAAEKQGVPITAERRAQIEQLSEAYADQVEKLRQVEEAQHRVDQAAQESFMAFKQGFLDVISGASSFEDALRRIGLKLAEIAASNALERLFAPAQGGEGGGIWGSIFSSIGSFLGFAEGGVMTAAGPRRLRRFARGGVSDMPAIFGEAGPEAAVPLPDGRRIPVDLRTPKVANQKDFGETVVVIELNQDMLDARIVRTSGPVSARISQSQIQQNNAIQRREQALRG